MLKAQVIGMGAAGNKALVSLIKNNILEQQDIFAVNSTEVDVPSDFPKSHFFNIKDGEYEGSGKERPIGKHLTLNAIQNGTLDLDKIISPTVNNVILVGSTEGGTASGGLPVVAKYIRQVLEKKVIIYAFTGFEEDPRGTKNTLEFFKDLGEDYTVHIIRNKDFLDISKGDIKKAEELANKDFAIQVDIQLGNMIKPSSQNIDKTELLKITTRPGLSSIEYIETEDKIKNTEQFNELIKRMIDNSKNLDNISPTQKIMGYIINIPENESQYIDHSLEPIIEKYGRPFERFKHVQHITEAKTFIAVICSGIDMPIEELKAVYMKYVEETGKVSKEKDSFFDSLNELNTGNDDDMFNTFGKSSKKTDSNKKNFFTDYNLETPNRDGKKHDKLPTSIKEIEGMPDFLPKQ